MVVSTLWVIARLQMSSQNVLIAARPADFARLARRVVAIDDPHQRIVGIEARQHSPSRPSIACLIAAPVTRLRLGQHVVLLGPSAIGRSMAEAPPGAHRRAGSSLRLRLGGREHRVGLLLEGREIDLHAVEHRLQWRTIAAIATASLDLLVGRAVELGGRGVEIDAVLAGDLRGDRQARSAPWSCRRAWSSD